MAFVYQGSIHGGGSESRISWEAAASLTTVKGALVQKKTGAATIAVKGAYANTESVFGINKKTLTATDTVAEIENTPTGSLLMADVDEIINGTVFTAASGSTSTIVCTAAIGLGTNDCIKGAVITVKTKATPGSTAVGTDITLTGYTSTTGTLTFAAVTGAFATGDTVVLKNLGVPTSKVWYGQTSSIATSGFGRNFVSNPYIVGLTTLGTNTAGDAVIFQISNNPGSHFKVLGTDDTGTKLLLVLNGGIDNTKALSTT